MNKLNEIVKDAVQEARGRIADTPDYDIDRLFFETADGAATTLLYDITAIIKDNPVIIWRGSDTPGATIANIVNEEIQERVNEALAGIREELETAVKAWDILEGAYRDELVEIAISFYGTTIYIDWTADEICKNLKHDWKQCVRAGDSLDWID